MPNWVRNRIAFKTKEGMNAFRKMFMKEGKFSFQNVVRRPKALDDIGVGSDSYTGLRVFLSSINKTGAKGLAKSMGYENCVLDEKEYKEEFGKLDEETYQRYYKLGQRQVNNYLKYGAKDWYDWNLTNWGCKWDAQVVDVDDEGIVFDTAWIEPMPIIKKIAKRLKRIEFCFEYANEDKGVDCGAYVFYKNLREGFGFDMSHSKQGQEIANDLWGE